MVLSESGRMLSLTAVSVSAREGAGMPSARTPAQSSPLRMRLMPFFICPHLIFAHIISVYPIIPDLRRFVTMPFCGNRLHPAQNLPKHSRYGNTA